MTEPALGDGSPPTRGQAESKPQLELDSGHALMAQGGAAFHDFVVQRLELALGRPLPQMEVRCKNMSIVAKVPVVKQTSSTATSELPSVYNSVKHVVRKLTASRHFTQRQILNRVDAVFEPGTVTLFLGQPGSGKSSLMKALSGQFPMTKSVAVDGDITYNGRSWKELLPKLPQLAAYVPQTDSHFPSLSVQETLESAHACCTEEVASRRGKELLSQGTPEQNEAALRTAESLYKNYPDVIVEQLGLQACRDTVIGNALKRGVSGGERRRVTMAETEFGMKYATFMDEVTNGLDSAATFDIVCTQRDIAKKLHKTVVMALLQPAPEVFELFDKVLLLNDGEVMYYGAREQVVSYFESLGFVCPPNRDVADFLMDLGTDQQHQYEVAKTGTYSLTTPRLASEFADVFRQSVIHRNVIQALEAPWSSGQLSDAEQHLDKMPQFRQSLWASAVTLTRRHLIISIRNTAFIRVRAFMVIIMGLVYGSTFYNFDPTNAQVGLGVLCQTTMFLALGQASQMPVFVASRDIFYKHRRANFYRSLSFGIGSLAALFPTAATESVVFGTLVYWMCGFVTEAGYYLLFLLCMILTNLALCAWFFTLTAMSPNLNIAKPMSTFSITFYVVFAGFVVPKNQLPNFLAWIYWINPVSWCLRTLAVSQYRSPKFDVCIYGGEDYCAQYNMTMGEYSLSLYDVPSDKSWVWMGVLYLIFAIVFFIITGSFILEHRRYDIPEPTVIVVACVGEDQRNDDLLKQQHEGSSSYVEVVTPRATSNAPPPQDSTTEMVVVVLQEKRTRFIPVTLAFKDLWYSVPLPHQKHESIDLLRGISGYALPGTMTALMGSSGAGKLR
ncbi:unnamed protein product [Phytophthora fragariaefolia]|uniref:Unnamed protein product n=1 Tax=Phytophthora fragariaefolia TaxID=1490495 RepID=A0A9W6TT78_9STRA|nr:unnamed protein product [Phytophthora fragariaefolia]